MNLPVEYMKDKYAEKIATLAEANKLMTTIDELLLSEDFRGYWETLIASKGYNLDDYATGFLHALVMAECLLLLKEKEKKTLQ